MGQWSQTEIAGKTADVFEPDTISSSRGVVLHLHGHGLMTLKDNRVYSAQLDRHGLRAICPHGQRSWWTEVVCPEFDPELTPLAFLHDHVVPYIADRWDVRPPGIALTGVSMGGQGVLQLAYRYPREFPVIAALAPAIDFHNWYGLGLPLDDMFASAEEARQQTAILQLHGLNWPRHQMIACDPTDTDWLASSERLLSKLASSGVPYESDLTTSNGGHSWDYFNTMAEKVMDFVADRLESMSRALPIA